MGRVIWAPSALEDADSIARFIARDSTDRAALFVTRIVEAADLVARHPEAGRIIPETNDPDRREILVGPYRVMYRIESPDVWIIAIMHGARDWPKPPVEG